MGIGWTIFGAVIGIFIGIIIILVYDKWKHKRLIKKYKKEDDKSRKSGSGRFEKTDFLPTEQDVYVRQDKPTDVSDRTDGKSDIDSPTEPRSDSKSRKTTRNPFKRRRK